MDENKKKICTGCSKAKMITDFDISLRTNNQYPRCKTCRKDVAYHRDSFPSELLAREKCKKYCVECGLRFLPKIIYQKTCSTKCDDLWTSHKKILMESEPCQIVVGSHIILLDADDYEWARFYEWHITRIKNVNWEIFYAVRRCYFGKNSAVIKMECEIMEIGKDLECDHINHNGMDNRKTNLRVCNHQQNMCNKRKSPNKISKYKGVCWHKEASKWRAYISYDGKYHHLGFYKKEEDAAKAYDLAAQEHYGKYACLNFQQIEDIATEVAQITTGGEWREKILCVSHTT